MAYEQAEAIRQIVDSATAIVIVQADNPDGDSLASALALEQILGDLGKQPYLYCGVDMPSYLTHMPGWDRVSRELPKQFDASIIVDTGAESLLEQLTLSGQKGWLKSKPSIVLDHHPTEATIDWASVMCVQPVVATGEVIYELALQLGWPLSLEAKNMLAISIMADSLGLSTPSTSARSIHIIAELVEGGVNIPELENRRRELMKKSAELVRYKGKLLERIEYGADGRVATIDIPWREIETYSPLYNPSMLVIDEMRMVEGVAVAIAFKSYQDGKITAKIRCNYGYPVARELAEHFGGGGHAYASGFKIQKTRPLNEVKSECIEFARELLNNLDKEHSDETLQHTQP